MKTLHILKTEPDNNTRELMDSISQGQETTVFKLYDEDADYEKLIDLIFEYDKTVSCDISHILLNLLKQPLRHTGHFFLIDFTQLFYKGPDFVFVHFCALCNSKCLNLFPGRT